MYRLRFGAVVVLISLCVVSAAVLLPTALYLSTIPDAPSTAVADLNGTFQPIMSIGRGMITSASWSPQGDRILLNTDLGAWLYTDTLADLHFFPDLNDANFSPDGRWIVGTMQIADESTQQPIYSASTFDPATFAVPLSSAAFNPDGELLATLNTNGKFQLWDAHNNAFTPLADNPFPANITAFNWSPDGLRLALKADNEAWIIWRLGESQSEFTVPPADQVDLHWSPDSSRFLLDFPDNRLQLWDVDRGSMLYETPSDSRFPEVHEYANNQSYPVYGYWDLIYWRPDGDQWIRRYPLFASDYIQVYDADTGSIIKELAQGFPYQAIFSSDSKYLMTSNLGLLETQNYTRKSADTNLLSFSWSPDSKRLALPSEIKDITTGQIVAPLDVSEAVAWSTYSLWSPDGSRILLWGQQYSPAIHDVMSGNKLYQIYHHVLFVELEFNTDESMLALTDETGNFTILDISTQMLFVRIPGDGRPPLSFGWQPHGRLISAQIQGTGVGNSPNRIEVWDTATGQHVQTLNAYSFAWQPDGKALIIAGWDTGVAVVEPYTQWKPTFHLSEAHLRFPEIYQSPDERLLWVYAYGLLGLMIWEGQSYHQTSATVNLSTLSDGRTVWSQTLQHVLRASTECKHGIPDRDCQTNIVRISDYPIPPDVDPDTYSLVEYEANEIIFSTTPLSTVPEVSWSPLGDYLTLLEPAIHHLQVWDVEEQALAFERYGVFTFRWSPDDTRLLIRRTYPAADLVLSATGETVATLDKATGFDWALVPNLDWWTLVPSVRFGWSSTGRFLDFNGRLDGLDYVPPNNGTLIWDTQQNKLTTVLPGSVVAWSSSDRYVIVDDLTGGYGIDTFSLWKIE